MTPMQALGRALKSILNLGLPEIGPNVADLAKEARREAEQVAKELTRLRTVSRHPEPRKATGGEK